MGSVSWRKRGHRYLVSWRLDDGSQGGKTVDTPDEARDLAAQKRLEMRRGTWRGRQRGRLSFNAWATDWWETWVADEPSPTSLASAESRLRLHLRPWFADRPIDKITPADVRRWQAHLDRNVGPATLAQCRSLALRIFQFATDEGAIDANPVHKVPPPKRRVDPEEVFGAAKRRALTPEEAGRLLAWFPLFWWDHLSTLLGTGLRFGELAGLRRRRVHLGRALPVLEVGPTRYEAGRFGSGFKPRPKSDAGIRQVPLAQLVVEAIRRQLPPAVTPMTWCSPVPVAADRACREAPGRCCHATTSTGPIRTPWPSWPTQRPRCDRQPGASCCSSATAGRSASTSSPPDSPPLAAARSARPRSRPPWASCRLPAWPQSTTTTRAS
jgi:integrase